MSGNRARDLAWPGHGLQKSAEEILNSEQKHKWTSEQMQVPPQIDGESCRHRMLYNMHE